MKLEKKRRLPFLDLDITRLDDRFITKVYRKDTHEQIHKLEFQLLRRMFNWNNEDSHFSSTQAM